MNKFQHKYTQIKILNNNKYHIRKSNITIQYHERQEQKHMHMHVQKLQKRKQHNMCTVLNDFIRHGLNKWLRKKKYKLNEVGGKEI